MSKTVKGVQTDFVSESEVLWQGHYKYIAGSFLRSGTMIVGAESIDAAKIRMAEVANEKDIVGFRLGSVSRY